MIILKQAIIDYGRIQLCRNVDGTAVCCLIAAECTFFNHHRCIYAIRINSTAVAAVSQYIVLKQRGSVIFIHYELASCVLCTEIDTTASAASGSIPADGAAAHDHLAFQNDGAAISSAVPADGAALHIELSPDLNINCTAVICGIVAA